MHTTCSSHIRSGGITLGFSSADALASFTLQPSVPLAQLAAAAARQPLLVALLELHALQAAPAVSRECGAGAPGGVEGASVLGAALPPPLSELAAAMAAAPLAVEAGTQTAAHPMERYIDRAYEWNEWALRRRVRLGGTGNGLGGRVQHGLKAVTHQGACTTASLCTLRNCSASPSSCSLA